ncbi:Imm1 family immunity protein [Nocardia sp. NPDC004654]|uniref:Imm1 family immunity protein n=1 Tax=Nocardia sp. NPDC004654 TaxID=3154776 RepID=UPI0033A223DD
MPYSVEFGFLPEHRETPVVARSGDELAAIVDYLIQAADPTRNFGSIFVIGSGGIHVANVGVGVDLNTGFGTLVVWGSGGQFCSCGDSLDDSMVSYYEVAHERRFPGKSRVAPEILRKGLTAIYSDPEKLPAGLSWFPWGE